MSTVYDADVTVTMRTVEDPVGLPYTVNSVELAGREVLVEIRQGPPGIQGLQGGPAWPWLWMGDIASFAALQALGLGTADARKAWRVVAENALYLWTGMEWVRSLDAFQAPGHQADPTTLDGVAIAGATGSAAAASITGTAPDQQLAITFPRGATGDVGDPGQPGRIADAQDVDMSGARQDYVLAWDAADSKFHPVTPPRLAGPWAIAGGQFTGGSNLSQSPKTLATMNIPALPYAWRPIVLAGTIAIQNHVSPPDAGRVNVEIRLGSLDGTLIGYGVSVGLANSSEVAFHPRWEYPLSPGSDLGVVPANTTAALYVVARRVFGSSNYSVQTANAQLIVMAQPYNP
ncbi:hypothetical protein [Nocardia sp. NPDC059236]|uniref:hypothetical protein n=1 Tax=Nocardia sp. NPDC059236 TaxID=3346783 RepID=UPI0036B3CD86